MDPLISGPDHPRWTDPLFLTLAQHKQEAAMPNTPSDEVVEDALRQWYGRGDWKSFYFPPRSRPTGGDLHPWDDTVVAVRFNRMYRVLAAAFAGTSPFDKSTIPEGYMLVPIKLPPGIVTQATPAVEFPDKPGNMVERVYRSVLSALQAKGY